MLTSWFFFWLALGFLASAVYGNGFVRKTEDERELDGDRFLPTLLYNDGFVDLRRRFGKRALPRIDRMKFEPYWIKKGVAV